MKFFQKRIQGDRNLKLQTSSYGSRIFYNYYEVKEAFFLDIYIDENNRVRQTMIEELDWELI